MAAVKTLAPLKWHGGKHYLAKRIIELMPPHLHYVEPFFGGGQVLLAREPSRDWFQTNGEKQPAYLRGSSEVINDINGELMNFWNTLREPELFEAFHRVVRMTPFSETLFDAAMADEPQDDLHRALNFFIRARQSRQGLMTVFATVTRNRTRGRRNEQVNAWWNVIDGLPDIHERLKNVLISESACDRRHSSTGRTQHTLLLRSSLRTRDTKINRSVRVRNDRG